jgi:osmotically-inducible protein OsmY
MKSDEQLKNDVTEELKWEPSINPAHVGVAAKDGVITLSGHLETFAEKFAIERAVQRVEGVKAVAVELDVKLAPNHKRSDSEIAEAVEQAFRWNVLIPAERIKVKVEKGWVSLSGELDWEYQRNAAAKAIRLLPGVIGVSSNLTLMRFVAPSDVSKRISDALARHAAREARGIEVNVDGSTVTLRGRVDSWPEHVAAQGAAWSAPGISVVVNHLTVGAAP